MEIIIDDLSGFLSNIGITFVERKKEFSIICPYHNDKKFGNAVVYKESQRLVCFHGSCKVNVNMLDLYIHQTGKSFKESVTDLTGSFGYEKDSTSFGYKIRKKRNKLNREKLLEKEKKEQKEKEEEKAILQEGDVKKEKPITMLEDFNPLDYKYTRERGFTPQFVEEFNIKRCVKGLYKDYFIIPIINSKLSINTFEARKLIEQEKLTQLLETKGKLSDLRDLFSEYLKENNITLSLNTEGKMRLHKKGIEFYDSDIYYLIKPKTLYESEVLRDKPTVWNIDNLNVNETLYIVEGIGSIPKIYSHITKNVTCVFGSKISDIQVGILNSFEHIILIPDSDDAGYGLVTTFAEKIRSEWEVKLVKEKDTDKNYVDSIVNSSNLGYITYCQLYHKTIFKIK